MLKDFGAPLCIYEFYEHFVVRLVDVPLISKYSLYLGRGGSRAKGSKYFLLMSVLSAFSLTLKTKNKKEENPTH